MSKQILSLTTVAILGLVGLIFICMWGCPQYSVYYSKMEGEALLAHARASKEVAVADAKAKMESASMLAQADTIRAHGVARANEIIGKSLENNQNYLYWLWLDGLSRDSGNIIYIPTEGNMPILEAGRFQKRGLEASKKLSD